METEEKKILIDIKNEINQLNYNIKVLLSWIVNQEEEGEETEGKNELEMPRLLKESLELKEQSFLEPRNLYIG